MIDLHSHTNESDGTCSPAQLIDEAVRAGVTTLGDHRSRHLQGLRPGGARTRRRRAWNWSAASSFPPSCTATRCICWDISWSDDGLEEFRDVGAGTAGGAARPQHPAGGAAAGTGFDITLEEAEARGRGMTGRPHFAPDHGGEGLRRRTCARRSTSIWTNRRKATCIRREPQFAEGVAADSRTRAGSRRWRTRCG